MATQIASFIPELWDAAIQKPFESTLVFADPTITNRKFEGTIQKMGDKVHINRVSPADLFDYEVGVDLPTPSAPKTVAQTLEIDRGKGWQLVVEDLDVVQAAGGFEEESVRKTGYKLANEMDAYLASLYEEGTGSETTGSGASQHPTPKGAQAANRFTAEDIDSDDPYVALTHLWAVLYAAGVENGGYAVTNTELYAKLLNNPNFINAEKAADGGSALRNGRVGRAANFGIRISTNVPQGKIYAGVPQALTVAQQLVQTEALRMERRIGNLIRGVNVYGAKVIYPEAIAVADLTS